MIGRTIGHYKILERIGAGGMGEVFAAEDLKLHRKVAFKILPHEVAGDPSRRARFEREATAVASLNHPNIVTVHSVEEADGIHFITMELVEGRTLTELIPRSGFALGRFFDLAVPLADAVAAAHRAGVIHRDLKPDNIVVTHDGRLKILDFGLAKLRDDPPEAAEASAMPTRHLTGQGQILGTVVYMSPEQVEGKPLDHRSDIFSMGIVLYEMATGRRPFAGDTQASVISSIMRDAPSSVTDLNPGLPRHLGRILRHCLAKSPEDRTQTAQDVRNQLLDLRKEIDSGVLEHATPGSTAAAVRRKPWMAAGIGLLVVAMAAFGLFRLQSGGRVSSGTGNGAAKLEGTQVKLTDLPGEEVTPSISPDGKFVAYAGRVEGNWDIFVQRVGGSNPVNLTKDCVEDDLQPAFSPNGERIAFRSKRNGGGIYVMGATGESVVRVSDFGFRPAWSPDGERIAVQTTDFTVPSARPAVSGLSVIEVGTGKSRRIFDGDAVQPSWSPDGRRIAYWAIPLGGGQRDIWTITAEGGTPVPVTQDPPLDWNPVWSPDGRHLYFSSERSGSMNLWRVAVEEATGRVLGTPEAVTQGGASEIHSASISRDGRRIAYVASVEFDGIRKVSLDPAKLTARVEPQPITRGSSLILWLTLSADGRSLAYTTVGAGDRPGLVREEIVVSSVDGSARRRIASADSRNRIARWSPSGDVLAFASDRSGSYQIYTVRSDGSDLQVVNPELKNTIYPVWSPTGDRIVITHMLPQQLRQVVLHWPRGNQPPEELPPPSDPNESMVPNDWSRDGSLLAGHLEWRGREQGGIALYHLETRQYERLTERGLYPHWLPDGQRLLYSEFDVRKLWVVDIRSRQVREIPVEIRGRLDPFNLALSADGRTLYAVESEQEADLWLMDLK